MCGVNKLSCRRTEATFSVRGRLLFVEAPHLHNNAHLEARRENERCTILAKRIVARVLHENVDALGICAELTIYGRTRSTNVHD